MSKQRINSMIPAACKAIRDSGLSFDNKVDKALRGQISAFGAAVNMGNLLSAVAFFSNKGGSSSERHLLMKAVYLLIPKSEEKTDVTETSLLDLLVKETDPDALDAYKEVIIDAAISIKLAMNLFELENKKMADSTKGRT